MNLTKNENGNYEAVFYGADGKRHTMSLGTGNKIEAELLAAEAKLQDLEQTAKISRLSNDAVSIILAGKKLSVLDCVAPWVQWMRAKGRSENTIRTEELSIRAWARDMRLERSGLAQIDESHVSGWINRPDHRSAASRRLCLAHLRNFFGFCLAKGWALSDPARLSWVDLGKLGHGAKERRQYPTMTDEDFRRLLDICADDERWLPWLVIGRYTGLRMVDVVALEWASIGPKSITVWTRKRDKRVDLPLEPALLCRTVQALPKIDPLYVFPEARKIILDPTRRSALSNQFRRICARAGLEGKSFLSLRHLYATEARAKGLPMDHIRRAMGHSRESTTRRYVNLPSP